MNAQHVLSHRRAKLRRVRGVGDGDVLPKIGVVIGRY